jgi:hypothetical protein
VNAPVSRLGDHDQEALKRLVSDLNDISPHTRARIEAGFERAVNTARGIADGRLDPLTH